MHSTHNEGKSVIAKRFVITYKELNLQMTLISENLYYDKLDDIVNKCNNTYHRRIKIKLVDVAEPCKNIKI